VSREAEGIAFSYSLEARAPIPPLLPCQSAKFETLPAGVIRRMWRT
jgi:hypothetical protein